MKNHKAQTAKNLFKAEFPNVIDCLTEDQLRRINEICKGDVQSIRQVEPLSSQRSNIDSYHFHLRQSTEIVQALLSQAYKVDDDSPDYEELMQNIAYFIEYHIVDISNRLTDDLHFVFETDR